MSASTLRLLGEFELETPGSGGPLRLGRKRRALVAALAIHGAAGIGRGRLIALLWPDRSDHDARTSLRQCLSLLRRELGAPAQGLDSDGDRVILRRDGFELDVARFETLASSGDLESMLVAAQLYRGDFLDGLDAGAEFARWAGGERERLRDIAHSLATRLSERAGGTAEYEAAVRLANQLLASDPLHEGCYRALIRLHSRAGLHGKALQIWNECRRVLRTELGIEPSAQTAAVMVQFREEPAIAGSATPRSDGAVALSSFGSNPAVSAAGRRESPAVFDVLLRGWRFFSLYTRDNNAKARASFETAIGLAGEHAEAIAYLGWTHWFDAISGWSADPDLSYRRASDCAGRALACNWGHPSPHALQGKVHLWRMEHEAALEQLRRAVAAGPSAAYTHFNLGDALVFCGRCDEAIAPLERSLELDANDYGLFLTVKGMALWLMGELDAAQAALATAIARNPAYCWSHGALAVVHAERGDIEVARKSAARARDLNRRLSLSFAEHVLPFRLAEHRQRYLRGWQAAGMPQEEGAFRCAPGRTRASRK